MNKLTQKVSKGKAEDKVFRLRTLWRFYESFNAKKAAFCLLLLALLTAVFASQLPKLRFSYSFDSFFPEGDADLDRYNKLTEEFGLYNDFLFVVLPSEEAYTTTFIERVNTLEKSMEDWPEVTEVRSPFELAKFQINPFGVNKVPLLPKTELNETIIEESGLMGNFFGREQKSIMLFLEHIKFVDKEASDTFLVKLTNHLENEGFENHNVSGKTQIQLAFTELLETELGRLLILGFVTVLLVLILLFRSFKGLLLPLSVLLLTIIWTLGFMVLTGKQVDAMVVMIPAILLIVALSDVVHFAHKFDDFLKKGNTVEGAINATVKTIGKATFLTSITTAIGFLSLLFIPIKPIREFGMYTAAGVVFAFLITFIFLPALLYFLPKPIERSDKSADRWNALLNSLFLLIAKYRKGFVAVTALASIAIMLGTPLLRINTGLNVGLQKDEPILETVAYFDKNFDGFRPFEMVATLSTPDDLFDLETLQQLERLESYLEENYGVKHIQSPLNIIKGLNSGIYGASTSKYAIPETKDLRKIKRYFFSPSLNEERSYLFTEDQLQFRILGRTEDLGSHHFNTLNKDLNAFIQKEINSEKLSVSLTGSSFLIDKTDRYVAGSLAKGLGFAIIMVFVFILAFFRSLKMGLLTLLVNALPVLLLFGLMGLLGIDLNISTAIVFTVAFGIAVDDSIHFIARYQIEKERKHEANSAVERTFFSTGKSILITTLIIAIGFSLLLTSVFSGAYYLGFFIVIAAVIALVLDIIILPILLGMGSKKS
ncbi:efflux RND transporter permease subunit [Roseivirga pacifica]